jgi:pyruvate dehydrogenase E2 component (dihydrolipoamide acetyltransferase)
MKGCEKVIREIIMPQYSITMEEGTINKWKVSEGDYVKKGQVILEIETDKTSMDVEAECDGYIRKIIFREGDVVKVTETIAYLSDSMDERIELKDNNMDNSEEKREQKEKYEEKQEKESEGKRVTISPIARKLAEENNIDYTTIKGTGAGGRITKEDVENRLRTGDEHCGLLKVQEASGFRKTIARNMSESMAQIPHYYLTMKIDATGMVGYRNNANKKLSYTSILLKATVAAIEKYPVYSSYYDDGKIYSYGKINIGFAVDINDRLMVPVLKDVNKKSIWEISEEVTSLIKKCSEGSIKSEDMEGACFIISNLGNYGVDSFTAIISKNQSGILAVGMIKDEAVTIDGAVKIRKMMTVTLSSDHRLIDGSKAARFLDAIKAYIEDIDKQIG